MRILPCPLVKKQIYAQQVSMAAPSQIEYIW